MSWKNGYLTHLVAVVAHSGFFAPQMHSPISGCTLLLPLSCLCVPQVQPPDAGLVALDESAEGGRLARPQYLRGAHAAGPGRGGLARARGRVVPCAAPRVRGPGVHRGEGAGAALPRHHPPCAACASTLACTKGFRSKAVWRFAPSRPSSSPWPSGRSSTRYAGDHTLSQIQGMWGI